MNDQSPFLNVKDRLFDNKVGFVIYDKFPVNKGHCLVVPHRVYSDYFDSTPEEIEGLNLETMWCAPRGTLSTGERISVHIVC